MTRRRISLVVLISGNGSNLQAIIDNCERGLIAASVVCVISNQPDAYGIERARRAGIPSHVLRHTDFATRAEFDSALSEVVDGCGADLIVLAGFMRILGPEFVARHRYRIINLHPSLLPRYKGLDTHARVLAAGDATHGASVHFVTAELDGGPIVAQARVAVESGDTAESLERKVHRLEHEMLPRVIGWIADGRIRVMDGRVLLDGEEGPTGVHEIHDI